MSKGLQHLAAWKMSGVMPPKGQAMAVLVDMIEDPKDNGEYELHAKGEELARLWDAVTEGERSTDMRANIQPLKMKQLDTLLLELQKIEIERDETEAALDFHNEALRVRYQQIADLLGVQDMEAGKEFNLILADGMLTIMKREGLKNYRIDFTPTPAAK